MTSRARAFWENMKAVIGWSRNSGRTTCDSHDHAKLCKLYMHAYTWATGMRSFVCGVLHGEFCVGRLARGVLCGEFCMGNFVWGVLHGGFCVESVAWKISCGEFCMGN